MSDQRRGVTKHWGRQTSWDDTLSLGDLTTMDHMLRLGNFMMNRSRGRRERYREIIRSQTTIHVIRVEVLMLRTVHQSGEHSPVH